MSKLSTVILSLCAIMVFSIVVSASDASGWRVVNSPQNFVVDDMPVRTAALNINGYNYVKVAEFAKLLDIDISYDETTDTVSFDKTKPYSEVRIVNSEPIIVPVSRYTADQRTFEWAFGGYAHIHDTLSLSQTDRTLDTGCTITYKNVSTDEKEAFQVISYSGDDIIILSPVIHSDRVSWGAYFVTEVNKAHNFGMIEDILSANNNIGDGTVPDTENTRKAVSEVFRVYINGQQVTGKLNVELHQNQYYHALLFDKSYDLADIETVRVEIGFKDNQE